MTALQRRCATAALSLTVRGLKPAAILKRPAGTQAQPTNYTVSKGARRGFPPREVRSAMESRNESACAALSCAPGEEAASFPLQRRRGAAAEREVDDLRRGAGAEGEPVAGAV